MEILEDAKMIQFCICVVLAFFYFGLEVFATITIENYNGEAFVLSNIFVAAALILWGRA